MGHGDREQTARGQKRGKRELEAVYTVQVTGNRRKGMRTRGRERRYMEQNSGSRGRGTGDRERGRGT